MSWQGKPLSQAALDDEAEHSEFLRKAALDLAAKQPPPALTAPAAPAPRSQHVSKADLDRRLSKVCEDLGRGVRKLVVEPLERKIADLEQKQIKLGGIWREGQQYDERTLVQKDGGLWLSMAPTSAKPGNGSPAWKLVVKRGAAG